MENELACKDKHALINIHCYQNCTVVDSYCTLCSSKICAVTLLHHFKITGVCLIKWLLSLTSYNFPFTILNSNHTREQTDIGSCSANLRQVDGSTQLYAAYLLLLKLDNVAYSPWLLVRREIKTKGLTKLECSSRIACWNCILTLYNQSKMLFCMYAYLLYQ